MGSPYNKRTIEDINILLKNKNKTYRAIKETNNNKDILYHCNQCNQNFQRYRHWYVEFHNCPICKNFEIVEGYNDFGTKRPDLIKYFVYDYEYKTHSLYSEYKALVKCPDCGLERRTAISNLNHRGFTCPCQKTYHIYYEGVNDIRITHPHVYESLVDKSKGIGITQGNKAFADFKCKKCGTIFNRRISNACRIGLNCPVCSENISYPNKFGRYFIQQTKAKNIKFECAFEWSQNKRYDIYFEYNGKKYVIELDGMQHYRKTYKFHHQTYKTIHDNDLLKEKLANQNNVELIRIDCSISTMEYIKQSILNSELNKIFDLSNIDWDYCNSKSSINDFIQEICMDYAKNELYVNELMKKYNIGNTAIKNYIKIGKSIGLIDNNMDGNQRAILIKMSRKKENNL